MLFDCCSNSSDLQATLGHLGGLASAGGVWSFAAYLLDRKRPGFATRCCFEPVAQGGFQALSAFLYAMMAAG
jgi:hypothetical protein